MITDALSDGTASRGELPSVPAGEHELMIPYNLGRSLIRAQSRAYKKQNKLRVYILLVVVVFFAVCYYVPTKLFFWILVPLYVLIPPLCCMTALRLYGAPTNIQVGAQGVRFHWLWPVVGLMSGPWLSWRRVDSIQMPNDTLLPWTTVIPSFKKETIAPVLQLKLGVWKNLIRASQATSGGVSIACFSICHSHY